MPLKKVFISCDFFILLLHFEGKFLAVGINWFYLQSYIEGKLLEFK